MINLSSHDLHGGKGSEPDIDLGLYWFSPLSFSVIKADAKFTDCLLATLQVENSLSEDDQNKVDVLLWFSEFEARTVRQSGVFFIQI